MSDILTVKIGNKYWDNSIEAKIQQSVESVSGAFSISFPQFMQSDIVKELKSGQESEILIADKTIIKGFIDSIRIVEKTGDKYIVVSGRDKTADLVDCDYVEMPNEWKKQTVLKIISDLCSPFGISVVAKGTASSASSSLIETYKVTEGVSVCSLISQICVDNLLMPVSFGDGKLTLIRAEDAESISSNIQNPGNVLEMAFVSDDTNRHSRYITKGQGIETPEKGLQSFLRLSGTFDDSIMRYRPKTFFPENPSNAAKCTSRSKWEGKYRAGMSRKFSYTVVDWTHGQNKKPWMIHSLIQVSDRTLNFDGELYCSDILFSRQGSKDIAVINLVPKFTFTEDGKIEKVVVD